MNSHNCEIRRTLGKQEMARISSKSGSEDWQWFMEALLEGMNSFRYEGYGGGCGVGGYSELGNEGSR